MFLNISNKVPVIAWWSGGIASAVTCWLCIKWFGLDKVRIVFIDTHNEDDDTYRFLKECEQWYDKKIEIIINDDYNNIQEVWIKNLALNNASGAVCSDRLKRVTRNRFEAHNQYAYQAFGFDVTETERAKGMKLNNPNAKPIFPLIYELMDKNDCVRFIKHFNSIFLTLEIPKAYKQGYANNNCLKTGCVQGGIGYWQKIQHEYPEKFEAMAKMEHKLTDAKGKPVTILKDKDGLFFLKKHPDYPSIKDISSKKESKVYPLLECNGFCGMDDIKKNPTVDELNIENITPL